MFFKNDFVRMNFFISLAGKESLTKFSLFLLSKKIQLFSFTALITLGNIWKDPWLRYNKNKCIHEIYRKEKNGPLAVRTFFKVEGNFFLLILNYLWFVSKILILLLVKDVAFGSEVKNFFDIYFELIDVSLYPGGRHHSRNKCLL